MNFILWVALGVLGLLAAAVVLLIVGLVRHRKALWVPGLVVVAMTPLLLPVLGALIYYSRDITDWTRGTWEEVASAPHLVAGEVEFERATGVALPPGSACTASTDDTVGGVPVRWLWLRVPEEFGDLLTEHFSSDAPRAGRAQVPTASGPAFDSSAWEEAAGSGARCAYRTHTNEAGRTHRTCVAYDSASGTALVMIVKVRE